MDHVPHSRHQQQLSLCSLRRVCVSEGVTLNQLLKKMQFVIDSGVLKHDLYKSQSFNHFHILRSP